MMKRLNRFGGAAAVFVLNFALMPAQAQNALQTQNADRPACGANAAGFAAWKAAMRGRAAAEGIGAAGLAALASANYAYGTIAADRGQKSFKLSFPQFMQKRGAEIIIKRGRVLKQKNAALFARIEQDYGVPPGPLVAIWGMETGFGHYMGKQNTLSAVATLAYDCRRPEFFMPQLYAALQLIDKGELQPQAIGAMHGEIGQTQFLPLNVLLYGEDGDGDGRIDLIGSAADALASTARFLLAHGWQSGAGYNEGEPNFAAIEGWNKAQVYQKAIAAIGRRIDE